MGIICLLLLLNMNSEGRLQIKHIDTFNSVESCRKFAEKFIERGVSFPEGTRLHCMETNKTGRLVT